MNNRPHLRPDRRGFTLIEALVVIGIIGIIMAVAYPSILNILTVRNLDNKAREVQTFLQMAKQRAVSTKIVHRVRFYQPSGNYWAYDMERLEADGTWARALPIPPKTIPTEFVVTITFPAAGSDHVASFSALGTYPAEAIFSASGSFPNFNPAQNSITLRSPKLQERSVDDERVLSIFMGGSIQYAKRRSS